MGRCYKIKHPDIFQGDLKRNFYFEGWYYKLVDKNGQHIAAFIVGIALNKKENTSHCFVQFFDGIKEYAHYFRYSLDEFSASETEFDVKIGPNHFSTSAIHVDIDQQDVKIKGDLNFEDISLFKNPGIGYGIMGAADFVPFLEGRHGVVAMDYEIKGSLAIKGEHVDFTGGRGYTEKDLGTSFPKAYIWMQTNHFNRPKTCFMAAIARIPFFGIPFTGPLSAFMLDGKIYRFGPDNFSKLRISEITDDVLVCTIGNPKYELQIDARKSGGVWLPSPTQGDMSSKIQESLQAKIHVKFVKKAGKKHTLLFEGTGINAGLEIMANPQTLGLK
jgi:hypothetical protein